VAVGDKTCYEYTALVPVYAKDRPEWLELALTSLSNQTVPPTHWVVVADGPLTPELDRLLDSYSKQENFHVCRIASNVGLGRALAVGVENCATELIARLDADDYAVETRCATQLEYLNRHPEVAAVGTNVVEFIDTLDRVVSEVKLPTTHDEILPYAKRRNPMRHPALMYRKSAVVAAGNYRDFRYGQDYDLVVRLLMSGARLSNLNENLTYMRVGEDFYRRRGGWKYLKAILKLKREFVRYRFYSYSDFVVAALGHAVIILIPTSARECIYRRVLRRSGRKVIR